VKQAIPQVTPRPIMSQGDLRNPTMFGSFVSWQPALGRPEAEKIALYRDPAFRDAFQRELESRGRGHLWGQMRVLEVGRPELTVHVGRTLEEIAASQGRRPVDAYFDLGIADGLATRFQSSTFNFDPAGVERLIADDRCLVGLSDGGAHVDVICDVGYATALLDLWVRRRGVLSLEKAVHKLTQVPGGGQGRGPRAVRPRHRDGQAASLRPRSAVPRPPAHLRVGGNPGHLRGGNPALRRGPAHRGPARAHPAQLRVGPPAQGSSRRQVESAALSQTHCTHLPAGSCAYSPRPAQSGVERFRGASPGISSAITTNRTTSIPTNSFTGGLLPAV
jgi:hypothetical protein